MTSYFSRVCELAGWCPCRLHLGIHTAAFIWWSGRNERSKTITLTCLAAGADFWHGCLSSSLRGLSPCSEIDWLLTGKFQESIQESKGRSCKIFWGPGPWIFYNVTSIKANTRPVLIQGVENTICPRLLSNQPSSPPLPIDYPLLESGNLFFFPLSFALGNCNLRMFLNMMREKKVWRFFFKNQPSAEMS